MANITIEYMILIPFLILQIFLLPYATSAIMTYWSTSSETIALDNANSQIGGSLQQLYFFLNNPSVSAGTVTNDLNVAPFIGNYPYIGNATLISVSSSGSATVLELTLRLIGSKISVTSPFSLGPNAQWLNSTFMSNSTTASITAYKDSNNTILLSFST